MFDIYSKEIKSKVMWRFTECIYKSTEDFVDFIAYL